MKKASLLTLLIQQYPTMSRKQLYALILCGNIKVNNETARDPQSRWPLEVSLSIEKTKRFVSRGGDKLDSALDAFQIECRDKVFLDCGTSTGGFTDCLLSRGARHVYAVDVGYAQFDYSLRHHAQITLFERTNVLHLRNDSFSPRPQAAVVDLSFRSLSGIADHILHLVSERWAVALIKPQFEWEHPPSSFNGIVRNANQRRDILLACAEKLAARNIDVQNAVRSSLKGVKGNIEYFFLISVAGKVKSTQYIDIIDSMFSDMHSIDGEC
jgi:23S rRNA (cytidine1920-2'-O)/16S rRNA (cytidine1409-2'-O)-methyltransferase